jgi:hypothetical protein
VSGHAIALFEGIEPAMQQGNVQQEDQVNQGNPYPEAIG